MKITILSYGSRGDVQPFVALGRGLQKRGHEVKIAAPHRFTEFVGGCGIPFVPLAGDPEEISRRINQAGTNAVRVIASIWDHVFEVAPQVSRSAFKACEGADLIIHSFLFTVGGHSWAREHGIPDVSIQTFPVFAPTSEFPNVAAAHLPPGFMSHLSHWLAIQIFWYGGNTGYGPARRANPDISYPGKLYWPFDKSRPPRLRTPMLCVYSPRLLPRPCNWEENIHITGYLFLEEDDYLPPTEVTDFLASGSAPVCITFGSMMNRESERVLEAIMGAIHKTGNRAIVLTGWDDQKPDHVPDNMLFIEAAPHDWLFPHCKAVIHHGGAGTTGAGLRAGVPNIVVPHTADQPFWGKRVYKIGAGPRPIPVRRLTADNLGRALVEAEGTALRERALDIGRAIRGEDGVAEAIRLIDAYTADFRLGAVPFTRKRF